MTTEATPPIFLERQSYRRRRMLDALRLLPVLGVMLWMFPLFWPIEGGEDGDLVALSNAATYVFGVWLFLILCALLLWRVLRHDLPGDVDSTSTPSDPAGSK